MAETLSSEDLKSTMKRQKSRSKKSVDKSNVAAAASGTGRYSTSKKASSFAKGSQSHANLKKKPKSKGKNSAKHDLEVPLDDNDDTVSSCSLTHYQDDVVRQLPTLVLGDYISPPSDDCSSSEAEAKAVDSKWPLKPKLRSNSLEECSSSEAESKPDHLKWPLKPKLRPNSPLLSCQPRLPAEWLNYIDYHEPGQSKMVRTKRFGLVDLDVMDPCAAYNPCLLDRVSQLDDSSMPCYTRHFYLNLDYLSL